MNHVAQIEFATPLTKISDENLTELLDHNRVAYQVALKAAESLKVDLLRLGREQARRDGQLMMPSFERILNPVR